MIKAIYVLGIGAAVLVNIAALTLLVLRYIPFPATARATGIIGVCLLFFSLEHFVGLGSLYPLFLPLTALSLFVIWSERAWFSDETFRTSEIVFLCALLYGALWRLSFPEVVEDNDRLADLHRVANYLAGAKLPPIDYWLPYQRFNYYYTFQHYSARTARPAVRLGAGRELHARPDHSSRSRARLGLGVPHACPRAPVGETVVDRGARDWRNGDLASPPFRSLTVFPQLFQLRIGRRGLDLQFAPSRPVRQLRRDGHLAGRLRRNAARGASADRDFRLPICDRRLSRGAGGLSASVPRAHHHGGHPALV